jgi:fructose PTS system EIIBC or EIIC component
MKIVAVTSCPTGIAHTYMAAESLEQAAADAGHEILVETQGAAGSDPLTAEQIGAADAVIFANDVEVRNRERFAGKPLVQVGVKKAINDAASLFVEAERAAARPVPAASETPATASPATKVDPSAGFGTHLRQWLMTGVSYMIPFVAAGGILIAIAFLVGGAEVATKVNGGTFEGITYAGVSTDHLDKLLNQTGWAGVLFYIGSTAFKMLVPILAGFIAYAMADRLGLVPGIVGGLLASAIGAGFLGGLVAGLLAGFLALQMKKLRVPRGVAGVMPVVVIPLVTTAIVGVLMLVVVGQPIASATTHLTNWLNGLGGSNAVLLGALLGLMMAFDLGGPINKVAYTFGVASLASGNLTIMAAVMAAGMVPPLAMALSTVVRPKLYTKSERQAGEAAWLLGASFITEGAIPFAAADPLRVIPSLMAGSAVTGAMSLGFGATSRAPHGGIWVVGLIGKPLLYVLAIGVGVVVSAVCVTFAKSLKQNQVVTTDSVSDGTAAAYPTTGSVPAPATVGSATPVAS